MYRFITLHWSDLSESARNNGARLEQRLRALHPKWRQVLSVDGLRILDTGGRPGGFDAHLVAREGYRFPEGAVLGQVFAGLRSAQLFDGPPSFRGAQADAVVSSGGASLIDASFGRYVAFVLDRPRRRLHVVRSPQGELPCYVAKLGEVSLYFSYFEDVRTMASHGFSIDWDEVANFVIFQRTRPGRSGLREVAEIRAGFRRTESPRQAEWLRLWDPAKVAAEAPLASPGEAADVMREAVMRTVGAYASRYERVFHNLSGGLDSSVVAACLGKAPKPPAVTCLNYYSDEPEGDERRYARLAAAHAGLPLHEAHIDGREIDLRRILQVVKGATPENYLYERPFKYFDAQWLADKAPQACFFGSGGDNVFFQPHTPFGAYDYLRLHGLGRDFLRVCFEAARLTRTDVLSVAKRAALARFESRAPAL
jgi:asparagine synthase (glutamine-hydrolysing)